MKKLKILLNILIRKVSNDNDKSVEGKLIHGIFWNFISAFAAQGFPLIAAVITARILGKVTYGQLGIINSTIILFSTFAGLGLGITATNYIAKFHQTEPERTGRIMGLTNILGLLSGIVMFLILFLLAPWIASNILASPELGIELRIASFLLIFNTLIGIQAGSLAGFGSFKDLARIAIFQGTISFPIMIIGVYFFDLTGAITALVIISMINFTIYRKSITSVLKKFNVRINYSKARQEINILWELSVPSMLSSVMVGPIIWVVNTIIINIPGGYAQLGIFFAADQWRIMMAFIPGVIGRVLLPLLASNLNNQNESLESINIFVGWFIVIIIALPLIAFPEIISNFYGASFSSITFTQVLAFLLFVSCIIAYREGIARKLIVKNLMWWGFLDNLLWAVILVMTVFLLKNLGALGLAIGYIVAYVLNTLIFVPFYLWKKVVPINLIISKEVIVVWSIITVQTLITVLNFPIYIRSLILVFSFAILVYTIILQAKHYNKLKLMKKEDIKI